MSQTKAQLISDLVQALAFVGTSSAPTNGMYLSAANTIAISTNGSQRVTVNSSGSVGIGDNAPNAKLTIGGGSTASSQNIRMYASSSNPVQISLENGYGSRQGIVFVNAGSVAYTSFGIISENTGLAFKTAAYNVSSDSDLSTGWSERARIDSSGRLLVGTSTSRSWSGISSQFQIENVGASTYTSQSIIANSADAVGGLLVLGKSRGTSLGSNTAVQNNDLLGRIYFYGADGSGLVQGATIEALVDGTPGANDMPGRLVFSTTADGASSPTERMRISNGGDVFVGCTSNPIATNITGFAQFASGQIATSAASLTPAFINRKTNDGTLVSFQQDTSEEGSISVSGTTVSYNGAHLSRWSQFPGIDPHDKTVRPEILRGTVMSNLDEMCAWIDPESGNAQDNEQLNKTKISDVEGDKNVAGVFQSWDDDDDTWVNDYYLAMTGDFVIRIAAGVTVERGDLLMSAGDGTAKPQDDDIIRSKTIAKVTSTNVSCTYKDGSYCVPCVLMAC